MEEHTYQFVYIGPSGEVVATDPLNEDQKVRRDEERWARTCLDVADPDLAWADGVENPWAPAAKRAKKDRPVPAVPTPDEPVATLRPVATTEQFLAGKPDGLTHNP